MLVSEEWQLTRRENRMIIAGRLVSTKGVEPGQIRVEGEQIVEVGQSLGRTDIEFDEDCLVFAGMGDIHIHARDDPSGKEAYKEDFRTASAAALNGGVVHVADMPNNPAAPIDEASYAPKDDLLRAGPPPPPPPPPP